MPPRRFAQAMNRDEIIERAERCRRLARQVGDAHLHNSLEALAEEYEAKLPRREAGGGPFMLRHR